MCIIKFFLFNKIILLLSLNIFLKFLTKYKYLNMKKNFHLVEGEYTEFEKFSSINNK